MFTERLQERYGLDEPILTNEIMAAFSEYSRPRVFQMIQEAEKNEQLIRYDTGVYYLPTQTEFGKSVISVNQVVNKKYIKNNGEIFGIYGRFVIALNFLLSYQVPNTIEVITNNETRRIREIEIRERRVILRKSRCPITNDNYTAYTIMELFSNLDLRQYQDDKAARDEIIKYIQTEQITKRDLFELAPVFPARTMKNLAGSGLLNEIA